MPKRSEIGKMKCLKDQKPPTDSTRVGLVVVLMPEPNRSPSAKCVGFRALAF